MSGEKDPLQSMDAKVWAEEFMRIWGERRLEIDEDLMLAWFANAIMRGFDTATNRQTREIESLRAEVERLDTRGIHTCSASCQRLPCVQRREIEELRQLVMEAMTLLQGTTTRTDWYQRARRIVGEG